MKTFFNIVYVAALFTIPLTSHAYSAPEVRVYQEACKQKSYIETMQTCTERVYFNNMTLSESISDYSQLNPELSKIEFNYSHETASIVSIKADLAKGQVRDNRSTWNVQERKSISLSNLGVPFSYQCNFSADSKQTEITISFESPQFTDKLSSKFIITCTPLSETEVAAQKQKDEEQKAQAIKTQKEAEWKASPPYKALEAANQVKQVQNYIVSAKRVIAEEREIGRVSGYVDKQKMHDAGTQIVYYQKILKAQWDIYKSNGGSAKSIDELVNSKK